MSQDQKAQSTQTATTTSPDTIHKSKQSSGPNKSSTTSTSSSSRLYKSSNREELRTLFISGLPTDIKEREIHNLFRFFTGYEGCILNENPSKQPIAFVSFTEREFAIRAMRYLQDIRFDLNSPQTLRIDFAKSNSKIKRLSSVDLFPVDKRRILPLMGGMPYQFPPPGFPPQYNTSSYGINSIPSLIPWFNQNMNVRDPPARPHRTPNSPSKTQPCSTLFVANLHPDVPENDLIRLFRMTGGFQRLKMSHKDGGPICFVEYSDVQSSTNAMQSFQGFLVGPSEIRIEYARSRMGESNRLLRESNSNEQSGETNITKPTNLRHQGHQENISKGTTTDNVAKRPISQE